MQNAQRSLPSRLETDIENHSGGIRIWSFRFSCCPVACFVYAEGFDVILATPEKVLVSQHIDPTPRV
jgi:hypothetical protein